jgi:DNA-binding NtrC family response regulator
MKTIIGQSDTARRMRKFLQNITKLDCCYLIGGEPGTGKEFLAKEIIKKTTRNKDEKPNIVKVKSITGFKDDNSVYITEKKELFEAGSLMVKNSIWLEPLREREADIVELTEFFIQKSGVESDRWNSPKSMKLLIDYWWPYNISELKRVVTSKEGYKMLPYANMKKILSNYSATEIVSIKVESFYDELGENVNPGKFYHLFLDSIERAFIKSALKQCGGSITNTAQLLNIHRNTLSHKIKKFRIK